MNNKKIFPQIKKQLQNFLTDESGKISKNNAIGVGLAGLFLWSIDQVQGHHCTGAGRLTQTFTSNRTGWSNPQYWGPWWSTNPTCRGHISYVSNHTDFRDHWTLESYNPGERIYRSGWNWIKALPSGSDTCSTTWDAPLTRNEGTRTFHRDCGDPQWNDVRGHYSYLPGVWRSSESIEHNNSHANY